MKTKWNLSLLLPILLFGLALAVSCTKDDNNDVPCAQISSSVVTEMRTVGDFQNILLEGIGTILLTQGPQQPLRIETHREILDRLDTRVVGEELQISLTGCINGQVDRLEIFVTIPEIRRIQVDGVGNVIAQNDFDLDDLNVELNGVGGITLQGSS
ncbi:MAG: DUF2807 domain-containing protein, partial [Saprospiraceae bacterium]|nr:DUF2807 domain-containing protein [Saprospiraceae bacterium]